MRSLVAAILLAGACVPAGDQPTAPPPTLPKNHAPRSVNPDLLCKRMNAQRAAGCGMFAELTFGATCPAEVIGSLSDSRSRVTADTMDECTSELTVCSDITACVGALEASPELRTCDELNERELGDAVGLPHDAWRAAMKRGITKYSQVRSSKAQPLDLCGVTTENYWMTALVCDDGSHPLANRSAAEKARLGNVGAGKCAAIVDHYRVRCPERAYDLYLDGSLCPEPQ